MAKRFQVAASPLNAVKFDLAIVLTVSVVLLIIVDKLFSDFWAQCLFLAGYGIIAMIWLVSKTKRVVATHQDKK